MVIGAEGLSIVALSRGVIYSLCSGCVRGCCVGKGLALLLNNSVFALGAFLPNQASSGWVCCV